MDRQMHQGISTVRYRLTKRRQINVLKAPFDLTQNQIDVLMAPFDLTQIQIDVLKVPFDLTQIQ